MMLMPLSMRQYRALKGLLSASFVLFSSLCMHLLAGGSLHTHPLVLMLTWALTIPLCAALSSPRPSLPRISVPVLLGQPLFHWVFTAGASPTVSFHEQQGLHAGHYSHIAPATAVTSGPAVDAGLDLPMLAAHGCAALLTIAVMHRFDQLVTHLSGWVYQLLSALLPRWDTRPLHITPGSAQPLFFAATTPHWQQVYGTCLNRRGPPSFA